MNCPVCGVKIKPWDWSQNCKKCGTNLFLHDFNKRLEEESVQAEKDFLWWNNMTAQFMNYGIKDKFALFRLIFSVLPLLLLCMPVITFDGGSMIYLNFLLDSFGGGSFFPDGFGPSDMTSFSALLPASALLAFSLLMATLGFFSVLVGPAFMNFRAPAVFELIGTLSAVLGTVLFNFISAVSISSLNPTVSASFGLYIYSAIMLAETVLTFCFTGYSKKFISLQVSDN